MSKRNCVVILSSEDEDATSNLRSLSSSRSYTKSKSRSTSASSRGRKKARASHSRSHLSKLHEIDLFGDDFNEVFTGSKVSAGTKRSFAEELWVDKYKPNSLEELAVHKKKVEDVKTWFEERLKPSKGVYNNNVLLISGQAGVGKSAAIHVIASHLGAIVDGWNTPTPVIWREHLYNSGTGTQYTSKLDEFESFVERVRKYGSLLTSYTGDSKPSIILLIDDLPMTNGKSAFGRLKNCLQLLVKSTQIPTAILLTDCGNADSVDYNARCLEELKLSLESSGACKVAFNPITVNSMKKVLFRICQMERLDVTADYVDLIAKTSGGDIRHAITSLQFFCLKPNLVHSLASSTCSHGSLKEENNKPYRSDYGYSLHFGRDEALSLFHALGKFLHNKRETGVGIEYDQDGFLLRERLSRFPLKMDVPEKILCQAHVQPGSVADFLHENGDADILLAKLRGMLCSYNEAEGVLQSAAASIAVRGVLFGNSNPLSSRWHAVRRPRLWQVEKVTLYKNEVDRLRIPACKRFSSYHMSIMATEYMPMLKLLGNRACGYDGPSQKSSRNLEMEDFDFDKMDLDEQSMGLSDDDIEDW
ncbi:cell cycle checkpoint protein RAD17 isoform X2 [Vigna radiata var. radiata]|uniref:Cell cycle checkpoint protein RAD17 isoform X2 n=1 Tax=Vigna radiata var. radiata TaxID=3916 RepID=A0A1S3UJ00_VIGRR|nr:cell cycle checkpoint protein RAD17 isoform X2 [Vigna radiata var. radiata]